MNSILICRAVKQLAPGAATPARLPVPLARHAAVCLRCQAELARYGRLRREMAALGERVERAPASLAPAVDRMLTGQQGTMTPAPRATPAIAALAGATAAAASVVAVALWRRARAAA